MLFYRIRINLDTISYFIFNASKKTQKTVRLNYLTLLLDFTLHNYNVVGYTMSTNTKTDNCNRLLVLNSVLSSFLIKVY